MPCQIKIKDINCFADVYEPVGESVETHGIILSDLAAAELYCRVPRNLIIPQKIKTEMPNVRKIGETEVSLAFAQK